MNSNGDKKRQTANERIGLSRGDTFRERRRARWSIGDEIRPHSVGVVMFRCIVVIYRPSVGAVSRNCLSRQV